MLFGISHEPANFQAYINRIFADLEKVDFFVIMHLDDILIYLKYPGQLHIKAVCWVLKKLWKHGFYRNLKNCQIHKAEVQFLGFVILAQRIKLEEKRIEVIKNWSESKLFKDI